MDETLRQVFKATRLAMNQSLFKDEVKHPRKFYIIAREHGLSGTLYPYLKSDTLEEKVKSAFKRDFQFYTQRDTFQMTVKDVLKTLFDTHAINHVFLKGAKLKTLYPESFMRSMGDIDILVEEGSMKDVHKVLKENGFTVEHLSDQHDVFVHPNETRVEVHPRLYKRVHDKYDDLFEDVWAHTFLESGHTYSLSPSFELTYLLYHIVKHFYGSGVGFRFFLDIGVYLDHTKKTLDLSKLETFLKKGNLGVFFETVLTLNKTYFGYDPLPDWRKRSPLDDQSTEKLTEFILRQGIHSSGHDANQFESQIAAQSLKGTSKTRFLFSKLFPSYNAMKGMYPSLKRVPFMLPVYWITRLLKKSLFTRKTSLEKLRKFESAKESTNQTGELFKRIGL